MSHKIFFAIATITLCALSSTLTVAQDVKGACEAQAKNLNLSGSELDRYVNLCVQKYTESRPTTGVLSPSIDTLQKLEESGKQ